MGYVAKASKDAMSLVLFRNDHDSHWSTNKKVKKVESHKCWAHWLGDRLVEGRSTSSLG